MATATQDFGIYVRENEEGKPRELLMIYKGMSVAKVRKAAAKVLKTKPVKKLFLSSGQEVKFVDELKQDAEVYASFGEKFFKNKDSETVPEIKVSILGTGGVGKSALTLRFIKDVFVEKWDPTIEDAYSKDIVVDDQRSRLSLLDTAGQDNFESMRAGWLRDKAGYIFVFAINSLESFSSLSKFVKLHEEINVDRKVPIILVANKIDVIKEKPENRKVSETLAKELAQKLDAHYIETSALTGENAAFIFESMVRLCRNNKNLKPAISKCCIL